MRATNSIKHRFWRRLKEDKLALLGFAVVGFCGGLALLVPLLPLPDPYVTHLDARLAPAFSAGHLLGTDHLGRDLLARLVWGMRASLAVGLLATLVAALGGTVIGLLAGYLGRWLDTALMRSIDVLMAFPYLLLALAIVAALGPGLRNAMVAIALVNIPFFARTVRGAVVSLREQPFVDAARLLGFATPRIVFGEIFPNVLPAVVVMMATTLGWMILETAGLSFLGLGAQPPQADLGSMLGEGREFLTTAPRVAVLPGLVILLLVVGINLLGDGIRDVLDPRHAVRRRIVALGKQATAAPAAASTKESGSAEKALLEVKDLKTEFLTNPQSIPAVDGISFCVQPGERLALVGESGSGKTQTALAILGLLPPGGRIAGGAIYYQNENLVHASEGRLQQLRGSAIAYVPQDPSTALDPVFTIGRQLSEVVRRRQQLTFRELRRRTLALMEQVRMPRPQQTLRAYPHELSGGMRQRAVIAMAIANQPRVIIADEATTALDVTVQAEIVKLFDELCSQMGTALVFITHDLGLVGELCDRILVLYAGRLVESAPVRTIFAQPRHPYTQALLDCAPQLGAPEKSLRPISGVPPPMQERPRGCHFAPRCRYVEPRCRLDPMALRTLAPDHRVRCVRAEELAS